MPVSRVLMRTLAPTVLALLVAACSGGEAPATPTAPATPAASAGQLADPTATPDVAQIAPYSLPTRDVPFTVVLPAGTTGPVAVRVFGVTSSEVARSVDLTRAGGDTWTATVPLEEGALVRYAYDRGDLDDLDSLTARREAPAIGLDTTWRLIHVAPELTEVRDTVAMWADQRAPALVGALSGVVTDIVTGLPVVDADVSVGGWHTATDFSGRYQFNGVAAGEHIVTVHRATGDYLAQSTPVTVRVDSDTTASFDAQPTRKLTVQIQVLIPEDLPAGASIKLYGNTWQTGAQFITAPGEPSGLRMPVAQAVRGRETERVQIAFDAYEGQSIAYRYTLAGPGLSSEIRLDGDTTPRSFIVSRANRVRVEQIDTFRPADAVEVLLRTRVPDNTPDDVLLQFVIQSAHWMTRDDDTGEWTTVLYGRPGDELTYGVRLGADIAVGADASPDTTEGRRTLRVPTLDTALEIVVTDWVGRRGVAALAEGELADVEFRITVPVASIPGVETLLLVGNRELSEGIELRAVPGSPTVFRGTAQLPAGGYRYDIRSQATDPDGEPLLSARQHSLDVSLVEHVVNAPVVGWSGLIPNVRPRETEFAGGYALPDWSAGFDNVSRSTLDAIEERGSVPVSLPWIWSYGQIRPQPAIESRPMLNPSPATPVEALYEQAFAARRGSLPVILAPRFNTQLTPDGASLAGPKSQQWIDAWLAEAEQLWRWNAEVADQINADILILPGPDGNAFDPSTWFPSAESFEDFDAALTGLIAVVRERFDGEILINGAQTELQAPAGADLVGITTADLGHPALAPFASAQQWEAAYDLLFQSRLDPVHDAWGLPVFIYELQVPSTPTLDDPSGEFAQARQLEGLLRALAGRTWVVGILSSAHTMIEAPDFAGDGVRGRLAEAVLLKYYALFNPDDISALTLG